MCLTGRSQGEAAESRRMNEAWSLEGKGCLSSHLHDAPEKHVPILQKLDNFSVIRQSSVGIVSESFLSLSSLNGRDVARLNAIWLKPSRSLRRLSF